MTTFTHPCHSTTQYSDYNVSSENVNANVWSQHLPTYSRCICWPGREYNKFTHTHTQTHTHSRSQKCPQLWQQIIFTASILQNNLEIPDQQKNNVNLIVEILNCKIQQESTVSPSCTRPGVFKHKLDFLNLFWLIDDFWFVLICKIAGFMFYPLVQSSNSL